MEGYLQEHAIQGGFGSTLALSPRSHEWMRSVVRSKLLLLANQELKAEVARERPVTSQGATGSRPGGDARMVLSSALKSSWYSTSQLAGTDKFRSNQQNAEPVMSEKEQKLVGDLYKKLKDVRRSLAERDMLMPAYVMTDQNLLDLSTYRITHDKDLNVIDNLPEARISKFGPELCSAVASFCQEHSLTTNQHKKLQASKAQEEPRASNIPPHTKPMGKDKRVDESLLGQLSAVARTSYELYEISRNSLEKTAQMRGVGESTVVGNLCDAVELGLSVDIDRLGLTWPRVDEITRVIHAPPINADVSRLKPIKEQLPDYIPYDHIKLTISILKRQYGLDSAVSSPKKDMPQVSQPSVPSASSGNKQPSASSGIKRTKHLTYISDEDDEQETSRITARKRKLPDWME